MQIALLHFVHWLRAGSQLLPIEVRDTRHGLLTITHPLKHNGGFDKRRLSNQAQPANEHETADSSRNQTANRETPRGQ